MECVCAYMIKKLVKVKSSDALTDAIKIMRKKNIGSVLVQEDKEVIGIFTERDLLNRVNWNSLKDFQSIRVGDVMTKDLKKVPHNESYIDVITMMKKHKIRHIPVVKGGKIIGIVSLRDLLNRYQEYLEHRLNEQEKILLEQFKTIKESEALFRTVFDHSAVGITMTDRHETIIMCNPFVLQLLGLEKDDLIGKPVKDLYPAEEWNSIRAHNIRKLGKKHHFETKVFSKHKKLIDVNIAISVLKDANGAVIGSIGFMRDISERKKLERIRREFVGVVSHELRTPLVPIREGVSQVLDGMFGQINDEQREYLTIVFNEINRLKRIVDDLLDVFRFEIERVPMKKELVDMNSVVKSVIATFSPKAKAKNLILKTSTPKQPVMLYVDRDRIIQVFANLIGNALKFTKEGQIKIVMSEKKRVVECQVVDTGEGMTKANLESMFKKFQQFRKASSIEEKGTGLGLVICKEIVELHKGKIWVKSTFRKGTTFTFTLPFYSAKALLKELMADRLKEAVQHDSSFSIVVFALHCDDKKEEGEEDQYESELQMVELIIRHNLRRSKDNAIRDEKEIFTMLPNTSKEGAVAVAERINNVFKEYKSRDEITRLVSLRWRVVNFPADGETVLELFSKVEKSK